MANINLKFDGICKECREFLPSGTPVRYYGKDRIYGKTCHPQKKAPARTWIDRYYGNADDPATLSEMDMNRMLGVRV